ncbi:MAG: hypothetical protein QXE52_08395 [Candidatus Caldarchaeum sp.]
MNRGWKIVLAFISGTIFAEVAADPTDYIYFQLRSTMTPEQTAASWYFLTAAFYTALFAAAYLLARTKLVTAENFLYALLALTVLGTALSWRTLSSQGVETTKLVFLLGIPLAVSCGIIWGVKRKLD